MFQISVQTNTNWRHKYRLATHIQISKNKNVNEKLWQKNVSNVKYFLAENFSGKKNLSKQISGKKNGLPEKKYGKQMSSKKKFWRKMFIAHVPL